MKIELMYTTLCRERCIKEKTVPDEDFLDFMDNVEKIVYDNINIYLLDLSDEDYYMYFDEGYTPEEVATIVIKNNHYNFSS